MSRYTVNYCNYTIGTEAYEAVAEVCEPFGAKILLIGGEKALAAAKPVLLKAIENSKLEILETLLFGTDCTMEAAGRCAEAIRNLKPDMIFAMGGGKALDTAKTAANMTGLPIFTFPTIAATCASTTALSVLYKENGDFSHFEFFKKPANHCFINTKIIAEAPDKYLRAGIGDTLAKHFECHFAARGDRLRHSSRLGREVSNLCYLPLLEYGPQALKDCRHNRATEALEEAVLANIVSTGMVSLLVLDEYNGAIAHSIYYALCLLPGFEEYNLHGDVVAYGVMVQLAVDGKIDEAAEFKTFLQKLGIRTTLAEMKVPLEREALKEVLSEVVAEPDMDHIPYRVTEDMIWDAMTAVENI